MSKIETGLTIKGTADFGSALIAQAIKANQEKAKLQIIDKVGSLLREVEDQRREIEVQQRELARLEGMAEALESGAFTLTTEGEIQYSNTELAKQAEWRYRCNRCGNESFTLSSHRAADILAKRR